MKIISYTVWKVQVRRKFVGWIKTDMPESIVQSGICQDRIDRLEAYQSGVQEAAYIISNTLETMRKESNMREKGDAVLIGYKMQSNGTETKVKLFPGGEIYISKTYAGELHNPSPRRAEIWCGANLDDFRSAL